MKLNYFTKPILTVGRWLATALFCVSAIALVWQGAVFSNSSAMAAPATTMIAAADLGDQVQAKTSKDAGRAKNFIRDAADKVEETARKNARRVDRATDDDSLIERKAKRDTARIHKRAEEDAARTQKAVDKSKSAVQRTVDNIKDALD